jgi:hypothetical protein
MMITLLPILNLIIAFGVAHLMVKSEAKKLKKNSNLKKYFKPAPTSFRSQIPLAPFDKFFLETILLIGAFFLSLGMNFIFSIAIKSIISKIGEVEILGMFLFGEFFMVLLSAIIIKSAIETNFKMKRYKEIHNFSAYVTEEAFYIPFYILEGEWRTFADVSMDIYLEVKYAEIKSFTVLPAIGIKQKKPPYYKIELLNNLQAIYSTRSVFFGKEEDLINLLKIYLENKIFLKDKIR